MNLPYPLPEPPAELPMRERPLYRVANHSDACNLIELLTVLIGGPRAGATAQALLDQIPGDERMLPPAAVAKRRNAVTALAQLNP